MTAYADYSYYTATYGGTAILQTEFMRLINQASAYLDLVTANRIADEEDDDTLELVKMAACAVADVLKKQESGGELQSERVGNYSVTYADTPSKKLSVEGQVIKAIKLYLGNTDLAFRGFAEGEYGGVVDEEDED